MTPTHERVHRFQRMLVTLYVGKGFQLNCPACKQPVHLKEFSGELRLRCPTCDADLVLVLGHNWLYTTICIAAGFGAAYLQGLQNPVFLLLGLVYSGALVVMAAPILAQFFPPKLKLASNHIQTLRIP